MGWRHATAAIILAVVAGLTWTALPDLGLQAAWPLLIGFAFVPLAMKTSDLGRTVLGLLLGIAAGWWTYAIMSGILPVVPTSLGITAGVAIAAIGLLGAALRQTISAPALYAGFGAFAGAYSVNWTGELSTFLVEGTIAAGAVFVLVAGGGLASNILGLALAIPERSVAPAAATGIVVLPERRSNDRRSAAEDRRVALASDYSGPNRRMGPSERRLGLDRRRSRPPVALAANL